jgi:O-antigen/teichoic acid export membrane protein
MKKFFSSSERTENIVKHIGTSSIYKIISALIAFFLVPLSISYLGSEKYGLWLTVFSFVGFANLFDFGVGNGLRNKLTIALSSNDKQLAKSYVSTAYFSMMFIVASLIAIFIIPFYFVPWESVFNYTDDIDSISQLIAIVYLIFSINLVLKMVTAIYYADQKSSVPGLIQLVGQIIIFISIYIAMKSSTGSLVLYGSVVVGAQMLVFILASFIAFFGRYSDIRPSLKAFDRSYLKDILNLGGKFFLIQIAATLVFSTDNFIINYYLGSDQVTVYNIAFKYFMFVIMAMTIIIEPYWSAFTSAVTNNEEEWIKRSIVNLLKISIFASLITISMIFVADQIYSIWVGESIQVPFLLTVLMGVNTIISVFMQPLIMYINGMGKLKIQMYNGLLAGILNIPLSIYFAINCELGVSGVILATLVVRLTGLIIYPIQVYKLINNKAKGIWSV